MKLNFKKTKEEEKTLLPLYFFIISFSFDVKQ
jgi:hypothetical protein